MEDWKSQFRAWLKEICPWDCGEDYLQCVADQGGPDGRLDFCVFTHDHRYYIGTRDGQYLGCTVTCRKPRAGEDWGRGNDLPDGKFCRETWDRIKNSIIAYELVKIAKPVREVADTPEVGKST